VGAITGADVSWEFDGPTSDFGPPGLAQTVGLEVNADSTDQGGGRYVSSKVDFPVPGRWTVTIHVVRDTPFLHDHATFRLLVP
jgi:hypothetical protein